MAACQGKDVQRLRYQNHRFERMPGMSLLLDAFALVDCGVAESMALHEEPSVCGPDCCQCCIQPIPATPLEILALRLYAELELPPARREALKATFALFHGKRATLGDMPVLSCWRSVAAFILCAPLRAGAMLFSASRVKRERMPPRPGLLMCCIRARIPCRLPCGSHCPGIGSGTLCPNPLRRKRHRLSSAMSPRSCRPCPGQNTSSPADSS